MRCIIAFRAVQQDADSNAGDFSNKTAQANVSKPKKTASKAKKPTGSSKGKEELGEESWGEHSPNVVVMAEMVLPSMQLVAWACN